MELEIHGCQDPNIYIKKTTLERSLPRLQSELSTAINSDEEDFYNYYQAFNNRLCYCKVLDELLMKMYFTPTKKNYSNLI